MTDKHSFLERLKAALSQRGVSEADATPYLAQFDRYYDRMVSDDLATAESLLDIESIADNISSQISDRYDEIDALAARTMAVDAVNADEEPTTEAQIPAVFDDAGGYEIIEEFPTDQSIPVYEEYEGESDEGQEHEQATRLPDYVAPEKIQDNKMFWVLLALSLPITLPLALAALSVFAVMWGAIIGVIVGAIAVLIAVVCLGTLISLIGVIYGVIQLFTSVPIGLYEIGIGVVVAGFTMLIGILLYNFAVRLMPIFIKLVGKLFRYAWKKLVELFNHLRKECAKL